MGVHKVISSLNKNMLTQNLSEQVIRSSTSAALNYGEAQSAESKKDFIHKNSVVLKELRETGISLKILFESKTVKDHDTMNKLLDECNQLTAIFQKTVTTAGSTKS